MCARGHAKHAGEDHRFPVRAASIKALLSIRIDACIP